MSARNIRRGLPRVPGGDPWPPEGVATPATDAAPEQPAHQAVAPAASVNADTANTAEHTAPAQPSAAATEQPLRKGLPRVAGGDPWPDVAATPPAAAPPTGATPVAVPPVATPPVAAPPIAAPPIAAPPAAAAGPSAASQTEVELRKGLPRTPGGQPWPQQDVAQVSAPPAATPPSAVPPAAAPPAAAPPAALPPTAAAPTATPPAATPPSAAVPTVAASAAGAAASATQKKSQTKAQSVEKQPAERPAWLGKAIGAGVGGVILLALLVFAARAFVGSESGAEFIAKYTGVAPTPASTPVGLPAWLGWSHFFNMFLMVMIIRTGLQIRGERKPPAYFTSKSGKKVSLTIWFHTSLDLLWLLNGVVFFVLLFATGQWMRIVPTSLDIFPNMASAAIQYLSLDWPSENGWIHYNALQQVAYFVTVFIAAPLAAITGYRMSNWWPKQWKFYPIEFARKVHFPTMLYFVLFIFGHVFLVFATGAKKNLGHMFAATPDGGWMGVILFLVSVVVTVGAVFAARPMLIAPIARIFGKVTNR
ncbi:cytochrome b/b6 domain-containing protein [Corynebacterium sp. H127]|uniref:cytochrome b/b6 domain-containing protein n=1 Tax=Corynebacterium sp. H127 TaxID=3133418 RepID=UPI0030B58397